MTNALEIKNLKKVYDNGVEALKGVHLTVATGDFFALLGPNGAGKSTTINVICGLVNKTAGEVWIEGLSIDDNYQKAKMHVGIVPQEFNFGIFERVIDIILDQAGYYGIPRREALPKAEQLLKQLGLYEKRLEKAMTLSGGMKRRLMIARGLVHSPKVLILDEPTAGVDIEIRREMWDFLRELNRQGTTIILTTHYLEEAEQLCKNMAIINKGVVVEQGPVKALLSKMDKETFIFDLEQPLSEKTEALVAPFGVKKIDTDTIEMTVNQGESLNDAISALNRLDVRVRSMRNKSNRLEEFFLQKIGK
ncbi:MAG: ABC transporter ATP-binding protein [Candidatus Moranbacteria bacterium]|jgi:ABC-2 type transport system ATP-binding protein|nr:ABC transporter ATP-binding protein [Candidatus Moranbacteria bacterium]